MGIGTVCAGTASAAIRGNVEVLTAILCLLFAIFTQLAANFLHAYRELKNYYANLVKPKIADEKYKGNPLAERLLREATTGCFIFSLMIGLSLMSMSPTPILALTVIIFIYGANLLLNFGTRPLFGTWWSFIFTFLIFGPIGVVGTCLIQSMLEAGVDLWARFDTEPPIYLGFAVGFFAVNIHLVFAYYNAKGNIYKLEEGAKSNINTVILKIARPTIYVNAMIAFLLMGYKIYTDYPDPLIAIIPIFLGLALNTFIANRMGRVSLPELGHLGLLSIVNYLLIGVTSLIIWAIIGSPDDSIKMLF